MTFQTRQSYVLSHSKNVMAMVIMVALGFIIHRLESLLPLPSPWIKLGLANLMTLLVALVFWDLKMGLLYQAAKDHMSLIGISMFGAYTHTLTISLCVYYFLIRESFFHTTSFFFSPALLTRMLTGSIANTLSSQMQNINFKKLH